ncbi:MAG: VTT domain-containing protein [bacterium]|nr:VTT domain-containing protein [bacterium]
MLDIIRANIYYVIFVGLFFAGETVLLPAIYLGVEGKLNLWLVLCLSLAATILSDLAWYFIGRNIPLSKILSFRFLRSRSKEITQVSRAFDKHALYILFISKFVYGTRTIAQILSGTHRVPFLPYLAINFSGLFVLNMVIAIVAFVIGKNTVLEDSTYGLWMALGVFAAVIILLHYISKKILWKIWSQQ